MIFTILIITIFLALLISGNYFYNISVSRNDKDFLRDNENLPDSLEDTRISKVWFDNIEKSKLTIESFDGLKLNATYIPCKNKTKNIVILAHGYSGSSIDMTGFAEFYNKELSFDVLMTDARGHGKSEGNYIGFGWHDRLDYLKWIDTLIDTKVQSVSIILHGVSMGGAAVLMTSGENLPSNVKAIIDDCGYTSVHAQLAFQLKQMYKLPPFPMLNITSAITKFRSGYSFNEASAINQVKKSKTPILFIHGELDNFVPVSMVYELFDATHCDKDLYIVKGALHANSFDVCEKEYKDQVVDFLNNHL